LQIHDGLLSSSLELSQLSVHDDVKLALEFYSVREWQAYAFYLSLNHQNLMKYVSTMLTQLIRLYR